MTAYDLYLLAHVVSVVVWVGAGFLMALLGARIGVIGDAARRLGYAQDSEWLGLRVFLPSSALALVSGVLLVHEGRWGYEQLWIQLGIVALALSTVIGVAVFAPGWKRVDALVKARGIESPEVEARMGVLLAVGWVDVGILLAAIWVMVTKPGGGDVGLLVVTASIPVAGTLLGLVLRRRVRVVEAVSLAGMGAAAGDSATD